MSEQINPTGILITEKNIRSGKFKQFYDFLYKDENYSGMKIQSKVLYTYLRDRMNFSLQRSEILEEEGITSAYKDEDGNVFCIASNPELELFLGCSEPSLVSYIKELEIYGLLTKVSVKDKPNRLYVLSPSNLSEECTWEQRVKEATEKRKKINEEKALRKLEKKRNLKNLSYQNKGNGNLKNLSDSNLKNLSDSNLKNLSVSISKLLNLNLLKNIYIYQSEIEEVYEKYVGAELIDGLKFKEILLRLDEQKNFKNFKAYLIKSIENELSKTKSQESISVQKNSSHKKKEPIPEWLNKENDELKSQNNSSKVTDERRKKLEKWISEYTTNTSPAEAEKSKEKTRYGY